MKRMNNLLLGSLMTIMLFGKLPILRHLIALNVSWTESGGYTMNRMFHYSDTRQPTPVPSTHSRSKDL